MAISLQELLEIKLRNDPEECKYVEKILRRKSRIALLESTIAYLTEKESDHSIAIGLLENEIHYLHKVIEEAEKALRN